MAHDEALAERLRAVLADRDGVTEKRMFGGLAFLVDGHLVVAAGSGGGLLLRCDPADLEEHSARDGVAPFVMRGRPMRGWLDVGPEAVGDDASLAAWVAVGTTYAATLPPK